jgi:probable F420-dependent oxidoreductase
MGGTVVCAVVRVSLGLPSHRADRPDLTSGDSIMAMARAAEAAGFEAVFVTEHPFPGDEWLATGGHHALDPFVALSFAAAATTRLRLQTNLLIAAYRNPFLTAKAIASLDALSGGRTIIGIGSGYMDVEFAALGVDTAERNDLTDEAIGAMRAAWTGTSVVARGRHWHASGNTMLPAPAQPAGPPIWIGGNSRRAMRRAVDSADGWVPMLAPPRFSERVRSAAIADASALATRVAEARAYAESVARDRPFEIALSPTARLHPDSPTGAADAVEQARELAAAGVTFLNVGIPGDTLAEVVDHIGWYGVDVLPGIAAL